MRDSRACRRVSGRPAPCAAAQISAWSIPIVPVAKPVPAAWQWLRIRPGCSTSASKAIAEPTPTARRAFAHRAVTAAAADTSATRRTIVASTTATAAAVFAFSARAPDIGLAPPRWVSERLIDEERFALLISPSLCSTILVSCRHASCVGRQKQIEQRDRGYHGGLVCCAPVAGVSTRPKGVSQWRLTLKTSRLPVFPTSCDTLPVAQTAIAQGAASMAKRGP